MVSPLQIVQPGETRTRRKRQPQFPVAGSMKPYGLYPIFASPVLPGESLTEAELKWRVLTLPIRNPFVGCWLETWLVYVSLTDIADDLGTMFISEDASSAAYVAAGDSARYFVKAGKIDYIRLATNRVVEAYFRDEEEPSWSSHVIDGVHMLKRMSYDWANNLMFKPEEMDMTLMPSALPDDGTYTPLEIMRMAGMSEITYEKYLMQFGVSQKAANASAHVPEILRYTREWTVPTNSIEPSTGAPTSVWAWGGSLKSEKPKRFDEPGFLVWFASYRPKMYDSTIAQSLIGTMWGFGDFFPVYNLTDPSAGIKQLDAGMVTNSSTGPVPLVYDHRDLLTHGEAFVNDWSTVYPLPTITSRSIADGKEYPDLRGQYPSASDLNALFVESTEQSPKDARMRALYEGIGSLTISGHVVDTTR